MDEFTLVFSFCVCAFIVWLCMFVLSYRDAGGRNKDNNEPTSKPEGRTEKRKEDHTQKTRKRGNELRWTGRGKQQNFSHPWHLTSFKGHTGEVLDLDFSSNGKYLATCSDDRTVFLWDVKDLKQRDHKPVRVNIEFDHPIFVKWSPDNKAFLVHRFRDSNVEVYKIEKKKDGGLGQATVVSTFPKLHEEEVVGMSIASNGKYIMTCSSNNNLILWDLKGQVLEKLDTCLMTTFCSKISPCGKFVFASGFSPDVKVWEVEFNKSGEYQESKRAFELTGHKSGIYDVSCNADSSRMVTVSKDGTWRLYDTDVEYKKRQDPRFLISGKYKHQDEGKALVALSPNGVIVVAMNDSLQFFSASNGKLDNTIQNVYNGAITRVLFDASGLYLLTSGPRHILVFHNVTGYKCEIESVKEKLKQQQTSATKERLQQIIRDHENFLKNISK